MRKLLVYALVILIAAFAGIGLSDPWDADVVRPLNAVKRTITIFAPDGTIIGYLALNDSSILHLENAMWITADSASDGLGHLLSVNSSDIAQMNFPLNLITSTDMGLQIQAITEGAVGAKFELYLNTATAADGDTIGIFNFMSKDDVPATSIYATILSEIQNPATGAEEAILRFQVIDAGTITEYLRLDGTSGEQLIVFGVPIRLPNNSYLSGRNNADDGNVDMFKVNASDELILGSDLVIGEIMLDPGVGTNLCDMDTTDQAAGELSYDLNIGKVTILDIIAYYDDVNHDLDSTLIEILEHLHVGGDLRVDGTLYLAVIDCDSINVDHIVLNEDLVPDANHGADLGTAGMAFDSLFVNWIGASSDLKIGNPDDNLIFAYDTLTRATGNNPFLYRTDSLYKFIYRDADGVVQIIHDITESGDLRIGDADGTALSELHIYDGGADNLVGSLHLYNDGGSGNVFWVNTGNQFRSKDGIIADDDAEGYAIIDLDDGTIGASGQPVNGSTITGEHLISSDDADVNDNLTVGDVTIDEAAGVLQFSGGTSNSILCDADVLTIGGVNGATNNENATFDFETTANVIGIGTGTDVISWDFGTIDLATDVVDASSKITTPEIENAGNIMLDPAVDGASYVDIANSGTGAAKLYIEGDQINSDDLSDVVSIAMLDENETITGRWDTDDAFTFSDSILYDNIAAVMVFDSVLTFYSGAATPSDAFVEFVRNDNSGAFVIGRTSGTESSFLSITDGNADNKPGFISLFDDGGGGQYIWVSTDHVWRVKTSLPADDDADGYPIIDADNGDIGASGGVFGGLVITATGNTFSLVQGTSSIDVAAGKAVDVDQNLTVNTEAVILNQSVSTSDAVSFAGITNAGTETATPSTDGTYLAAEIITVTRKIMRVAGNGAARTLTSTPSVADGAIDGVIVILQGFDDANTLTLQDESALAGSGLELDGDVNMTLGENDVLMLMFDSGEDAWLEISRSDNDDD